MFVEKRSMKQGLLKQAPVRKGQPEVRFQAFDVQFCTWNFRLDQAVGPRR